MSKHKYNHGHSHGHDIQAYSERSSRYLSLAFTWGIIFNLLFVVVEFSAGFILNSVALMSDAGHNLSDVVSLGLALLAFRLARRKPSERYTYGRKKSTVLVSFVNALLLLVAIGIILIESIDKLRNPEPVPGGAVAWVAGVGILINAATAWLFLKHRKTDLNVKGAYLHMLADTLVSVGVLISGVIIYFTGIYIIDPIIGILIAVIIFISTWGLLRDSVRLSLDGVPGGMDIDTITDAIKQCDQRIVDVHHVHIWALSTTDNALTAHVTVDSYIDSDQLKSSIRNCLKEYNITHVTLELELPGECHPDDCDYCR